MKIRNKRIFLTGGAGFIGTNLIRRLVDENEIVIYDNFHRNAIDRTDLLSHPNVKLIKGDILDTENLKKAIDGSNIVIHLAAIAGVDTVLRDPIRTMKVNMIGTYNVLEASLSLPNLERFINFSTSEVFGAHAYKVEETHVNSLLPVGEARWCYAISKLSGEYMTHSYYEKYKLPTVIIRPFNIYGPGQVGEGAIHHFILRAINEEDLIINGDGSQIRAWCYIDDMVTGTILCLEKEEAIGEIFNIGNPRSTVTIYDLAERVIRISKARSKIVFRPLGYTDVEVRIPNIDKAKNLLGFQPKVELDQGIKKTLDWYRAFWDKKRIGSTKKAEKEL